MLQITNKAARRLKIVQEHEKIQEAKNGNKNKKSNNDKRFPNKKKGCKGNKQKNEKKFKNKRKKHLQGNYEWKDCFDNPNGRNYDPEQKKKRRDKDEANAMRRSNTSRKKPVSHVPKVTTKTPAQPKIHLQWKT